MWVLSQQGAGFVPRPSQDSVSLTHSLVWQKVETLSKATVRPQALQGEAVQLAGGVGESRAKPQFLQLQVGPFSQSCSKL